MDIIKETARLRDLAKKHKRYRQLAINADVDYEWLAKFANNKINNPGVNAVGKLQRYFQGIDNKTTVKN